MTDTPTGEFDDAAIDQFASSEVDWSKLFSPIGAPLDRDIRADPTPEEWEQVNRPRWGVELLYEYQKGLSEDFLQRYDAGTQDVTNQLEQQGFHTLDLRWLHTAQVAVIMLDHFITEELGGCATELLTGAHCFSHFGQAESVMALWLRQRFIEAGAPAPHEPEVETDGGTG